MNRSLPSSQTARRLTCRVPRRSRLPESVRMRLRASMEGCGWKHGSGHRDVQVPGVESERTCADSPPRFMYGPCAGHVISTFEGNNAPEVICRSIASRDLQGNDKKKNQIYAIYRQYKRRRDGRCWPAIALNHFESRPGSLLWPRLGRDESRDAVVNDQLAVVLAGMLDEPPHEVAETSLVL